ncbi:MAG TPA: transposase [Terriglobales bacterium]|nr:transposase [Terriglobales bacterium]
MTNRFFTSAGHRGPCAPPLARVKIILRANSGFCRENLMAWCQANQVYYTLGLRCNQRLHGKSGHRS